MVIFRGEGNFIWNGFFLSKRKKDFLSLKKPNATTEIGKLDIACGNSK